MRKLLSIICFVAACGGPTTTAQTVTTTTTTTPPAPTEIAVGKPAPAFKVTASDGTIIDSAALKGKPIVVYFYPKDETSGCTTEACAFRDAWDKIEKSGVVLVGVSIDTDDSHRAFAAHHKLPFHLVSDTSLALAKQFGVATKATDKFGTIEMRETIVIGKMATSSRSTEPWTPKSTPPKSKPTSVSAEAPEPWG